jgi:hypothetical protein
MYPEQQAKGGESLVHSVVCLPVCLSLSLSPNDASWPHLSLTSTFRVVVLIC